MQIVCWDKLLEIEKHQVISRPESSLSEELRQKVKEIIARVKAVGDQALFEYTQRFDRVELTKLMVTNEEFKGAEKEVLQEERELLSKTITRLKNYHQSFTPKAHEVNTQDGVVCRKVYRPIQHVGLYVPGGSAPLLSTLMMLSVPSKLAGCPVRVLCTPVNAAGKVDSRLLVAAKLCGIDQVYKVGGAQAIAAMAYGTESVPKVDKIYGPGNAWVTEAKVQASQDPKGAALDMPAGPSEVLVIADDKANAKFVAADLLAQAEHGPDSQAIFITDSAAMAQVVKKEVEQQVATLSRASILMESIKHIRLIVTSTLEEAIEINNLYAPEHLILNVENAESYLPKITSGSAIFMGAWTPEALGDYVTGSNHVLPTYGYAKSFSGLSVADFMVAISVQNANKKGIQAIGQMAMDLAEIEGLDAHKMAVQYRLESLKNRQTEVAEQSRVI